MDDPSPKGEVRVAVIVVASIATICLAAALVTIVFLRGGGRFTFGTLSDEEEDREYLVNNNNQPYGEDNTSQDMLNA